MAPPTEEPRRTGAIVRMILAAAGVALLALAGFVGGVAMIKHKSVWQVLSQPIAPPPEQVFGKDHLLVLIVGLDYDYSNNDEEYSKQSRSDVIKAVNLDFTTHKAYVLSIPRDMDAIMPNGEEAKINQAQSDGGIKESQAVIAKWLGIPAFDRYVILRIDTMKDLVNAIGGVDLNIMNSDALKHQGPNGPLDYDDNWGHLHVHLKPGLHHLNGDQAVGYARFRHDWCSDPCRIMRQDQVVKAVVAKLKNDKLNTFAHMTGLIGVMQHDVETNLTSGELLSLANGFSNVTPNAVQTNQVPYVGDKEIPAYGDVIIPDTAVRAKLVQTMLVNPPRPQPSPDQNVLAAIAPAQVRVDVLNGTGIPGLGKRVAALLKAKGFTIGEVSNAPTSDIMTTELHEHSGITFAATKVRAALGAAASKATIVSDGAVLASPAASPAPGSDVTVVVGQDLAAKMSAQASAQQ
ncbi:MAG: LCP family protein [Vulcanimicrobiaceae bacterium]